MQIPAHLLHHRREAVPGRVVIQQIRPVDDDCSGRSSDDALFIDATRVSRAAFIPFIFQRLFPGGKNFFVNAFMPDVYRETGLLLVLPGNSYM